MHSSYRTGAIAILAAAAMLSLLALPVQAQPGQGRGARAGTDPRVENRTYTLSETGEAAGVEHEYVELPGISHGPAIAASQQYVFEFFGKHSKQQ